MTSKILDPRAIPLQTVLFIFALAYFYSGISFSPGFAFWVKLLFGSIFFIGLFVSHLVLVNGVKRARPIWPVLYGIFTFAILSVFVFTGFVLFIVPGVILFLLLFPVPALSSKMAYSPSVATLEHLKTLKGRALKELARRFGFHALLLLGFLLFFTASVLLLAHGDLKTAFFSVTRPSMIHEFLAFLYLIATLPLYTAYVRNILRKS